MIPGAPDPPGMPTTLDGAGSGPAPAPAGYDPWPTRPIPSYTPALAASGLPLGTIVRHLREEMAAWEKEQEPRYEGR